MYKDGESTALLSILCQYSAIITVKKVFPDVRKELPVFQFVPIASRPVTGHH